MERYIQFPNGYQMPIVGLGTWQTSDEKEIESTLNAAFDAGYRHFDTAFFYANEKGIGKVLRKWLDSGKVKREELFIVTKLPPIGLHPERVPKFLSKQLKSLQLDYIDLYLIHSPLGFQYINDNQLTPMKDGKFLYDMDTDLEAVWKAMEREVDIGKAKSIGVSNFDEDQLERISKIARIPISNIQMELHLYNQQKVLRQACAKLNISICAYAPFGSPARKDMYSKYGMVFKDPGILDDSVANEIAKKYNKTAAQVVLRFIAQQGIAVIPKSSNSERLKSNMEIFDFQLSPEDMERLEPLDQELITFDFKTFDGAEDHPECPKYIKRLLKIQEK